MTGRVMNTDGPVIGARVVLLETNSETLTNAIGVFRFMDLPQGDYSLSIEYDGNVVEKAFTLDSESTYLGDITLATRTTTIDASEIAVVSIDIDEEGKSDAGGISSILTASKDPFLNAASYNFSTARFNVRGLRSEDRRTFINGFAVNDLDDGGVYWGTWGGLNDVFRAQESTLSMESTDYSLGGIGGSVNVDLRASSQRPQTKAVYNFGNRSYTNRLMLTHSSGMNKNGWAYSFSGSRRWGQRGYVQGTYYDAWSYFAGVEKKINDSHNIGLTILGVRSDRGRSSGSTAEMYELVGNRYYNPNWGYQNGKVRNARAYKNHQPIGILRHDWTVSDKLTVTTSLAHQTGYNGTTRLDWYNAPDPRPDYYRKLPSYQNTEEGSAAVAEYIKNNIDAQQLNWDRMYAINKNRSVTIKNANGSGTDQSGRLSAYVIENQRYDNEKYSLNSTANAYINDNLTIDGGLGYNLEKVHNYKLLDDLLGGEFYVDLDKFAERDFPANTDAIQNDLNRPNRILKEGDKYGWDYDIVSSRARGWGQARFTYDRVDFFAGAELSSTSFYREGFVKNGKFPDNSLGKSAKQNYFNYATKGGITFKLDGRNYFMANGSYRTIAPYARYAYTSPRTRDQLLDDQVNEIVYGGELSYVFKYPRISGKITGYFTQFDNSIKTSSIYFDRYRSFGNYVLRDVSTRHQGLELGAKIKVSQTVNINLAAGVGANQFVSRPTRQFTIDNRPDEVISKDTVFLKNYYQPGPQSAYSITLNYNSPKYWFANLSVNHFRDIYLDVFPDRRTNAAVANISRPFQDELFYKVIGQPKMKNQTTVDLFAGKSWKYDDYYIFLYASVSNILNNRDFITGGFEQYRFDFESLNTDRFQPRTYYAYGTNYQVGLSLSF